MIDQEDKDAFALKIGLLLSALIVCIALLVFTIKPSQASLHLSEAGAQTNLSLQKENTSNEISQIPDTAPVSIICITKDNKTLISKTNFRSLRAIYGVKLNIELPLLQSCKLRYQNNDILTSS